MKKWTGGKGREGFTKKDTEYKIKEIWEESWKDGVRKIMRSGWCSHKLLRNKGRWELSRGHYIFVSSIDEHFKGQHLFYLCTISLGFILRMVHPTESYTGHYRKKSVTLPSTAIVRSIVVSTNPSVNAYAPHVLETEMFYTAASVRAIHIILCLLISYIRV